MPKKERKEEPLVTVFCHAPVEKSYYSGSLIEPNKGRGQKLIFGKCHRECWNKHGPCIKCGDASINMTVFADKMFHCQEFAAIPMSIIKDKDFQDLYKKFETVTDNAHTTKQTVVIYLLKKTDPDTVTMLWTCSHFEEQDATGITGLAHFMCELERWTGQRAFLEVIDTYSEKLMISVHNVPIKYPTTKAEERAIKLIEEVEEEPSIIEDSSGNKELL